MSVVSRFPSGSHLPHLLGVIVVLASILFAFVIGNTETAVSNRIADAASNPVNTTFLSLGILGLLALAYADRSRACALRVTVVMLTETALVHLIKFTTGHLLHVWPRPSGGEGGFPSGHAAAACSLAYLLTERMPRLVPLWYGLAALISWSRVEAGAHYPYQIVGGAILGLTVALVFSRRFARVREAIDGGGSQTGGVAVGAGVGADGERAGRKHG